MNNLAKARGRAEGENMVPGGGIMFGHDIRQLERQANGPIGNYNVSI